MRLKHLVTHFLKVFLCVFVLEGPSLASSLGEAQHAYFSHDYKKARDLNMPLAEQGSAPAQTILGAIYYLGLGVPQDYKEAEKWYRLSAEQGVAVAQHMIGVMYSKGQYVPQDYREAVKWYRRAAEQGYAPAQSSLGMMYSEGKSVHQDYVLAYMWFNLAYINAHVKQQREFIKERDSLAETLHSSEISEGHELAKKCIANHFKGC